jgi:hypothetical protein
MQKRSIRRIVDLIVLAIVVTCYASFFWISRVLWLVPVGTRMGLARVGWECGLISFYALFGSLAFDQYAGRRWPASVGWSKLRQRAFNAALLLVVMNFLYFLGVIRFRHLVIVPGY